MRKFLFLLVLAFAACTQPLPPVVEPDNPPAPVPNVRVYTSAWEIVAEEYIASARDLTSADALKESVDIYNSTHTDDQRFFVEGEEVIPIEEAPNVDAWIVTRDTHAILSEYLDWPRVDLVERRDIWRYQAQCDGGVLYVDNIPPAPIPTVDERPVYEKYALYLVTADGVILYEEHPLTEEEFIIRRDIFETQARSDGNGEYVIAGRLYP
ncbi:MAG: hypothetical protein KKB59_14095 [Spirochaetes bacterium]|nr:hypothetical protein [Spirochaetota bacterium]